MVMLYYINNTIHGKISQMGHMFNKYDGLSIRDSIGRQYFLFDTRIVISVYRLGTHVIYGTCDPFDLFYHKSCYLTIFLLGFQYNITILTLKSIFWVKQFYFLRQTLDGAVLFDPAHIK